MGQGKDAADRSRGATLVEYALIVGLVATVAMVSVEGVRASVGVVFGEVKRDITVGDSTEAIGGIDTTTSLPATTSPPTNPPTTTTTTAPTTTAPTTTTTTAPKVTKGGGTFGAVTTSVVSGYWWTAQTTLTVRGTDGQVIAGAEMTVLVRRQSKDWWGNVTWTEDTVTVTTAADGTATITGGPWLRYGSTQADFTVTGGTLPGGVAWDGTQATASTDPP